MELRLIARAYVFLGVEAEYVYLQLRRPREDIPGAAVRTASVAGRRSYGAAPAVCFGRGRVYEKHTKPRRLSKRAKDNCNPPNGPESETGFFVRRQTPLMGGQPQVGEVS